MSSWFFYCQVEKKPSGNAFSMSMNAARQNTIELHSPNQYESTFPSRYKPFTVKGDVTSVRPYTGSVFGSRSTVHLAFQSAYQRRCPREQIFRKRRKTGAMLSATKKEFIRDRLQRICTEGALLCQNVSQIPLSRILSGDLVAQVWRLAGRQIYRTMSNGTLSAREIKIKTWSTIVVVGRLCNILKWF